MGSKSTQVAAAYVAIFVGASSLGCGAEMVRPRAAGERVEARPGRAMVIGQFDVEFEGVEEGEQDGVRMTRHRVLVGEEDELFAGETLAQGRTFALWVYPGVFCFGRPTVGEEPSFKLLGEGTPCAEIPEKQTAYYVGSVTWRIKKDGNGITAELDIADHRESAMASRELFGIYPETAMASTDLDAEKVAAKYKLP